MQMKEQLRAWPMIVTQLVQTTLIAVLIGCAFLRIGTDQISTTKRQPVLFFCVVNQVRRTASHAACCAPSLLLLHLPSAARRGATEPGAFVCGGCATALLLCSSFFYQ